MRPIKFTVRLSVITSAIAVVSQNSTVSTGLQEAVGWVNNPSQRGTLMLLLECATTIFACTWTVLHLNVPALTDSKTARVLRKVKWMSITILFPEFIFAKGVCELRFALHTLHLMAEKMNKSPAAFQSDSIHKPSTSPPFTVTRKWEAAYGPWMQLLHRWIVLPLWPQHIMANQLGDEESNDPPARRSSTSSVTRVEDPELGNAPLDAGIPMSERTGRQESQVSQVWTISHAYYANMGGLVALKCETDCNTDALQYSVLRGDHLAGWELEEWRFGHPLKKLQLSAADIDDKSKADWLVKLFSMVQISRLILDLINRAAIHRPITQFELGTAAFAVFAIITYLVNWWKPKDISHPTSLHEVVDERRPDEAIERSAEPFFNRLLSPMPRTFHYRKIASQYYRIRNDELWMDGDYPVVWPLMAASCVVFGAFHCIAWGWQFPTHLEQLLWQISSVVSTVSPLVPLAFTYFLILRGTHALVHHQSEAAKEALTKLRLLRRLPEAWVQLLKTSVDDQQTWGREFGEGRYEIARNKIVAYSKCLLELKGHRSALAGKLERGRQANVLENIWKGLAQQKDMYWELHNLLGEKWDRYEEEVTLVARSVGTVVGLENYYEPRLLKTLHDCCLSAPRWTHRWQYVGSKEQLQSRIRRYAKPTNIFFGIVYAISRLILIGIMFSSLREVPKGVYEVTSWTRFLPSFS
ncbi:hypothetical protein SMACR_09325 [Sordaria macrospora]|nr:hypothetical protein SMACR_09325 [Sordaria macrospora]WPJ62788.1 hypothetical protein SMAC4_09325 [Sordaria macrospora]